MSRQAVLERTVEDIRTMRVRGALDIAMAAVRALGEVACKEDSKSSDELYSKLQKAGAKLKSSRPTAISLPNAVNYLLYVADKNRDMPLPRFRKTVNAESRKFVSDQEKALERIAEIGANLIRPGETVMTHCNSDTVMHILKKAWADGKGIKAVCTESRPRYQGRLSAKELSSAGIPTTMIVDSCAHLAMKKLKVDKVIVGADTICASGDLINKIGTSQVALCAKDMDVDFIVATESLKFSPQSVMGSVVEIEERDASEVADQRKLPKVKIWNPGFDVTDAEYISMIITEYGVIPPQAAYHLLKEKFGWEIDLK